MGRKILIDTNIAIGYIGNRLSGKSMDKLDTIFDAEYHISVINKIELLGYPNLDKNEEEKFNLLINHSILHPIDNKIIEETISIRKLHKIKFEVAKDTPYNPEFVAKIERGREDYKNGKGITISMDELNDLCK